FRGLRDNRNLPGLTSGGPDTCDSRIWPTGGHLLCRATDKVGLPRGRGIRDSTCLRTVHDHWVLLHPDFKAGHPTHSPLPCASIPRVRGGSIKRDSSIPRRWLGG